jgi:hypothetical protein
MNVMSLLKACRLISVLLAILIFFTPSFFFSQNLASVCNLFQQKESKPAGPCGHKALSSKANPVELGMGLTSAPLPENIHRLFSLDLLSDSFVPITLQPNSPPLRC